MVYESRSDISPSVKKHLFDGFVILAFLSTIVIALTHPHEIEARLFNQPKANAEITRFTVNLIGMTIGLREESPAPPEMLSKLYAICAKGKEQADLLRPHASLPNVKTLDRIVSGCASLGVRQGTPPILIADIKAVGIAVEEAAQAAEEALHAEEKRKAQEAHEIALAKAPEQVRSMASWK